MLGSRPRRAASRPRRAATAPPAGRPLRALIEMIRIFRHYVPRTLVLLGVSEAVILLLSVYVGISFNLMEFNPTDKLLVGGVWPKALVYSLVMLMSLAGVGLYQRGLRDDFRGRVFRIGVAFLLGVLFLAALQAMNRQVFIGHVAFTAALVCSVLGVLLFRALVYRYSDSNMFKRRVLILGTGTLASQVEQLRRRSDWQDMLLIGFVHVRGEPIDVHESKVLYIRTSLLQLALEHHADEIVVAIEERRHNFPLGQILDCKMSGVQVVDLLGFFEQATGRLKLDAMNPSSLIFSDGFIQAVLKGYAHRALDVALSAGMLAVVWPVMVATAAAIWLESRGPVLYRQVRVGRNNRHFQILKFRSMTVDAEKGGEAQWATTNDARVTRIGTFLRKSRLDELPQLINVLRGDMSFVGPRPERPEFVEQLAQRIPYYDLRHRVNPGITGWAQICYPYGASDDDAKEKLQYDLYYIKNYSLFLDLMILIQTAQVILWGKGAR
jgi:sugar transferase (PEP-CTERM system associated)